MAPEILNKKGHGKPVDMWAVGVLAYFLLSGAMPFETKDSNSVKEMNNIMNAKYDFEDEEWNYVSDSGILNYFKDLAKDFIRKLFIMNPNERLTAEQAFSHEWFHILESYPASTIYESPIYNTPVSPSPPVKDLYPKVKEGLTAKKIFGKAVDVIKAVNKLAAGISKSHIHLGTEESVSPGSLSRASSSLNLSEGPQKSLDLKDVNLSKSRSHLLEVHQIIQNDGSNSEI